MTHYCVVIPPPPDDLPGTMWHDPEEELTRGAWRTQKEAFFWARENLEGYPYTLKEFG